MAIQGIPQPSSAKKKSHLLRDFFKLCRSISRIIPPDKSKPQPNLHTQSKTNENPNSTYPPSFNFQQANELESANLSTKKTLSSLSRSCSHKTAFTNSTTSTNPTIRSLSYTGRCKSSRSFANPILYSSSSARVAKPAPTEEKLSCTLEELYNGCTKKIKIKRDVISSSGFVSILEETVEINVKPGWREGTKVTFEGKGIEAVGSAPAADLIFVVVEIEHQVFKRRGNDLEMVVEVSLLEALTGFELSVTLPDGDKIGLKIDDVIHPGYSKVVQGKGMPNAKGRGDLRVLFQTKFPQKLSDEQRAEIRTILQDCS